MQTQQQFPDLIAIAALSANEAAELEQQLVSYRGKLRASLQACRAYRDTAELEAEIESLSGRIRACRRRASAAEIDSRSRRIEELERDLIVAHALIESLQLELGRGRRA